MSRAWMISGSDLGPIQLEYIQCDRCSTREPDHSTNVGWIHVERAGLGLGHWSELDFCSIEHLTLYFTPKLDAEPT